MINSSKFHSIKLTIFIVGMFFISNYQTSNGQMVKDFVETDYKTGNKNGIKTNVLPAGNSGLNKIDDNKLKEDKSTEERNKHEESNNSTLYRTNNSTDLNLINFSTENSVSESQITISKVVFQKSNDDKQDSNKNKDLNLDSKSSFNHGKLSVDKDLNSKHGDSETNSLSEDTDSQRNLKRDDRKTDTKVMTVENEITTVKIDRHGIAIVNNSDTGSNDDDIKTVINAVMEVRLLIIISLAVIGVPLICLFCSMIVVTLYHKRYPVRMRFGRKFMTFENPQYKPKKNANENANVNTNVNTNEMCNLAPDCIYI